jgi:hypothetical protein
MAREYVCVRKREYSRVIVQVEAREITLLQVRVLVRMLTATRAVFFSAEVKMEICRECGKIMSLMYFGCQYIQQIHVYTLDSIQS